MASATQAKTEIRELSVTLALADAAWCADSFETASDQLEYYDAYSALSAPKDGFELMDRCLEYGVIDADTQLNCVRNWSKPEINAAARNYGLGRYLADTFGLAPGGVEWISWTGPENNSGSQYWANTPADVQIKLEGTPGASDFEYGNASDYGAFEDDTVVSSYSEPEADILISLKDGSKILGNLGFANVAGLLLNENYDGSVDFFDRYAHDEYRAWFRTALELCAQWLKGNDLYFIYESNSSSRNYSLIFDGDDTIDFSVEDRASGKVVTRPMSVSEGTLDYYRSDAMQNKQVRKCLSKWIETIGFYDPEYLAARRQCCKMATKAFMESVNTDEATQRFYGLVGSRMVPYYYAAVVGKDFQLYQVPTYYTLVDFPLEVEFSDVYDGNEEESTTSAVVPFTLRQEDYQVEAFFSMYFSFSDGEFSAPPEVKIHSKGENVKLYIPCDSRYWEDAPEDLGD